MVNRPVVSTHFNNSPKLLGHPQQAVFDFSTAVVSSVFDLGLDAAGVAQYVVSSTAVHLGTNIVAKTLYFVNENNVRVGTVYL
ncbi:hypothetical protein EV126DRAFT_415552 [Verticillium dahliae]|nr:hypothetical protein EV126DRAFT_415552 [Verticillium dahliae]